MIVNNSALWKKALAPDKKVAPPTVTPVTQPVQPTQPTSEPKIDTEKVDRLQKELDAVKTVMKRRKHAKTKRQFYLKRLENSKRR